MDSHRILSVAATLPQWGPVLSICQCAVEQHLAKDIPLDHNPGLACLVSPISYRHWIFHSIQDKRCVSSSKLVSLYKIFNDHWRLWRRPGWISCSINAQWEATPLSRRLLLSLALKTSKPVCKLKNSYTLKIKTLFRADIWTSAKFVYLLGVLKKIKA